MRCLYLLMLICIAGNVRAQNAVQIQENSDGSTTNNRITWFKNQDGTVRQLWEQSIDKGKTWNVAFDGLYKKKI